MEASPGRLNGLVWLHLAYVKQKRVGQAVLLRSAFECALDVVCTRTKSNKRVGGGES